MRAVVLSRVYADPANRSKLRALAGLGCSIAAVVPATWGRSPDGLVREAAFGDDGGVRIIPIAVTGDAAGGGELRWDHRTLRRALADFRPDLVQLEEEAWTSVAACVARASARLAYRVCCFSWESLPEPLSLGARWRRDRVLRRAAGLIGGNRSALARLTGERGEPPHEVIPQLGVVPPLAVERAPQERFTIGFIGRLVPERGLDVLFRACVRLGGTWTLHVVGTGPSQEELEALAARLGIAAHVTWHGALSPAALEQVWPTLDCVALPSRTTARWVETRARTALEAMARGIPVVGTNTGALPDVIAETGRVVAEDDVESLAATLQELHDRPDLRRELGAAARQRVLAEFVDGAIARRTLQLWRRLLPTANP